MLGWSLQIKRREKNLKTNTESRTKQKIKIFGNRNLCENSSYQNWETPAIDNLQTDYRMHHPSNWEIPTSMIENIDLTQRNFNISKSTIGSSGS